MKTLVIAEHDHGTLKSATRHTVTAALKLGGEVHILLAGSECDAAAADAANVAGVAKVLVADATHYRDQLAENVAPLAARVAGTYTHVFVSATASGRNLAPRIAALLDVAQVSDVIDVLGPETFVHPTYAGNALVTVRNKERIKLATVRATAFSAASSDGVAAVESILPGPVVNTTRLVGRELLKSSRPELGTARVIVSGGRGLGSHDSYQDLLIPLADKLNAALGASRAAVDAGYAPNDYQVGQTGHIVAPDLYLAIGISGAIQHLAGMKDSKVIVAINKDEEAPIFQIADYALVGDLFEIIPELTSALA